jgi:cytochrome c553
MLSRLLLVVTLLVTVSVKAQDSSSGKGQVLYQQLCVACHGANGAGISATLAPNLTGLSAAYIERQLHNVKSGVRGEHKDDVSGKKMVAVTSGLNDTQLKELGSYLSSMESVRNTSTAEGANLQQGKKNYLGYCAGCHGATASGNDMLNSPNLTGLDSGYFTRQYENFLSGVRGSHANDKFGRQMAMIASSVKDPDVIDNIAAYITTLP